MSPPPYLFLQHSENHHNAVGIKMLPGEGRKLGNLYRNTQKCYTGYQKLFLNLYTLMFRKIKQVSLFQENKVLWFDLIAGLKFTGKCFYLNQALRLFK